MCVWVRGYIEAQGVPSHSVSLPLFFFIVSPHLTYHFFLLAVIMPLTRSKSRQGHQIEAQSTSASPLERLPLHLLELITALLGPRSLAAFSQTSRLCCSASEQRQFRCISFLVSSPNKLRDDIARWKDILARGERYRHVRVLKIKGHMRLEGKEDEEDEEDENTSQKPMEEASKHNDDDEWTDPCAPPTHPIQFSRGREVPKKQEKEAWNPLAHWVKDLQGLTDVVHQCSDQIAPRLLSAIHRHHPAGHIRLHMHVFSLRSLIRPKADRSPIDPDDWAIATSPCLHTVVLRHLYWYHHIAAPDHVETQPNPPRYYTDANLRLVARMITGLAPNLSYLELQGERSNRPRGSAATYQFFNGEQPPALEEFIPQLREPVAFSKTPTLRQLVIPGVQKHKSPMLLAKVHRDAGLPGVFHKLESLVMLNSVKMSTLEDLAQMGSDNLPALRVLRYSTMTGPTESELRDFDQAAAQAIQALPPLKELEFSGYVGDETYAAIRANAGLLEGLHLSPRNTRNASDDTHDYAAAVKELAAHFPNVKDLALISLPKESSVPLVTFGP